MMNDESKDDVEFSAEFPKYREENVREPVERYTIHNVMLKPFLDEDGSLRGKRVLDLACGHGHYTRQLKSLNCDYILGIDLSSSIIDIAQRIERENPQGIEYKVGDVINLSQPEQPFDLVTAFYLFDYAQTRQILLEMIQNIYAQLGEQKQFIGIIGNVVDGTKMFNQRKYGITRNTKIHLDDDFIPDETEILVTLYNERDEPLHPFINYHYSPNTYTQLFKQVGFKHFQWIPYQYDQNATNRHFFDDLIQRAPSIGIVATK
jgi:SAM-dependent methyltransferase